MKQYIQVTKEARRNLMRIFGCTERMVFFALHFDAKRGNSGLATRIRRMAVENGGVLMVKDVPAMETLHDHDGRIRQYFPNGVRLEFCRHDNSGDVFLGDRRVRHYDRVLLSDIEGIQDYARTLR